MTVASLTNKSGPYNGNGSTANFAVNTKYTAKAEVTVIVTSSAGVETTKTLDTHYTLTAAGDSGTVSFITSPTDFRPQTGETVTIITVLAQTQATDFTTGGAFTSAVVEGAFDKLTRLVHQIAEKVTRAPKLRQTSTTGEVLLPEPSALAFLRWNAAADALENGTTGGAGSGDVVGPASSTDHAIARFDGTGGTALLDSAVTITDAGIMNGAVAVGVNATADTTNRLSVNSAAVLFNHEGAGAQIKVNKNAAGDTASYLFQTGFSGRAEFGTIADNDFTLKTSPDGSAFTTALIADNATGALRVGVGLRPSANDGAALGSTTVGWADLHLATGGTLNWVNGDVTITHSANLLTLAGGDLALPNLAQTGFHDLTEIAAPSSPASNVARTYAVDDGAGVTTLTMKDSGGNVVPLSHFLQTGTGAVTRTQHAKQRDLLTVTDFGAVGDGVTNDTTAITAADAIAAAKYVPSGFYDTTLAAIDLDGPYWGDGQIRDSSNQHRAPWFSAVKAAPSSFGTHTSITTAFDGDLSKVQLAMEHRITGAATLGQPTTGYLYTPEAYAQYGWLRNESGHNQELASNVGRTSACFHRVKVFQVGQGDCVAYNASAFVNATKASSTDVLANPAASLFNGDIVAGQAGVYLNAGEMILEDAGFDVAGAGWVINMNRTVATGAKTAFWFGFRSQSTGAADVNAHFSATGACDVGLDFSSINTDANLAAIALLADDRVYGNALNTNGRFATSLGDDYFTFSSSLNAWNFVTNNVGALQIYTDRVTSQVNVVINHTAALAIGPSTTPRIQALATDGNGIGSARYSNGATGTSLFLSKSRGAAIGTNTVVVSGDTLGLVRFCGADGTNFIDAAIIEGRSDGTPGTNDMPGALYFSTTPDGASAAVERLRITSTGAVLATAPLGGLGYRTGAGGAQTQATNKTTTVVLNTICGQITMAAGTINAGAEATFAVTNSAVATTDCIIVNHDSVGTSGAYFVQAHNIGAGSFSITVTNLSAGNLDEQIVLNFAVIKSVAA